MARLPIPGKDQGVWGDVLNDFLSVSLKPDGSIKPDSVNATQLSGDIPQSKVTNLSSDLAGKAPSERAINTGTGLTGGGDLSADRTLSVQADTTVQRLEVAQGGTLTGTRKRLNFISGANATVNVVDDSANNKVDITVTGAPGGTTQTQSFTYYGDLIVGTGTIPFYNDSGAARTITAVRASVGTAPTGASVIIDVNVNGGTIFPTQSERPTIASAQTTSGKVGRSAPWPNGQAVTVDVDQIGSSTAGQNLIVTVEYS